MVESSLNSNVQLIGWVWVVIFWIFIIILSLIGLKWLVQEPVKKNSHKITDNLILKNFINKDKNISLEKMKTKGEIFSKGRK